MTGTSGHGEAGGRATHGDADRRAEHGDAGRRACRSLRVPAGGGDGILGARRGPIGRLAALAAAVIVAGVLLAGCTGSPGSASMGVAGGSAASAGSADAGPVAEPDSAGSASAGSAGGGAESGGAGGVAGPAGAGDPDGGDVRLVDDRQIIRTASVNLQVTAHAGKDDEATRTALADAASQAATKIRALAPGTGGYVSASDGGGATISVTLRIPADSYETVMDGVAGIGRVTSKTEKTKDVTDEMIDVASRVTSMKASVQRIRALLAEADKIGDVITIESELAQREADLESLENRRTALRDQVALSTITVTVTAVTPSEAATAAEAGRQNGFLAGLAGGWQALIAFGTWLGSVVGALLPFSPLIAAAVAVLIWVRRRRHSELRPVSPPSRPGDLP